MTTETTAPSYWLNWRFLLCAIWIAAATVSASLVIWRYESGQHNESSSRANGEAGDSNKAESWATCSKSIHPIWLLAFRIVAFCSMLALLLADTIVHSVGIFYFYTQWTFTLVIIYFGVGSFLSILGCLRFCFKQEPKRDRPAAEDTELGSFVEDVDTYRDNIILNNYNHPKWDYAFQILFQMCAGAVVLTDSIYWLVLYPFFAGKDYKLAFLVVCMHSVNAVFILGDTILNSMRFPFFRIAYFVLWTCVFVVFQWIFHAFVSKSWPYTFLDLSSPYAPLWYLAVGLLHIPCFGIFFLIFKIKQRYLSR